jgi:membrane dipeptidase
MRRVLFSLLTTILAGSVAPAGAQAGDPALVATARGIHDRVIALDTHNDINPANFTAERNYTTRLRSQVNIPKMEEGGLDASFFIVFVGQSQDFTPSGYGKAYQSAMEKFQAIHRLTEEIAPQRMGLALTPDDVRQIAASGRKVALIGIENAYPLGEELGNIRTFYDLGGRYLSLAHNGHSQFSDSNTGEREGWKWNGLSPLGRQAIPEMNKVGMMIDVSHPSKASMMQTLALTKAPIIASHSAIRALCDHSRNLDDEQLLALKKNGGVVQVVAFSAYVKCDQVTPPERQPAIRKLAEEVGLRGFGPDAVDSLPADKKALFQQRMADIDRMYPAPPRATVADFVNHIDYAVNLIGIEHVGISSDFDGGGGVEGWNDASETFNVTLELVKRGYTEPQIGMLWSGNLLRVMGDVQRIAKSLGGTR